MHFTRPKEGSDNPNVLVCMQLPSTLGPVPPRNIPLDLPSHLCVLLEATTTDRHALVWSIFISLGATDNKFSGSTPFKDLISDMASF